jgi:hypothetical protein
MKNEHPQEEDFINIQDDYDPLVKSEYLKKVEARADSGCIDEDCLYWDDCGRRCMNDECIGTLTWNDGNGLWRPE